MAIITLSIKQKFFDAIIAGEKKEEFREVTPVSDKKYLIVDEDGYCKQDAKGDLVPRKYDVIKFFSGQMKGKRPTATVEITSARCEIMVDEETGEAITYMFDDYEHTACRMVYGLGAILEQKTE